MSSKIDLVYLWVDGSDEKWLEKRNWWAEKYDDVEINNPACRYADNDELKYSLRSVEKYAPWINKVFIVVNEQCPRWLETNHPKIKIIDLKDFIPGKYLPVFSSNTIEAFLPYIPDLSEKFLYANDDMMLAGKTTPGTFYTKDNKAIVRASSWSPKVKNDLYVKQLLRAQKLIYEKVKKKYPYNPHHNIDPYFKSDFINCINDFQDEFEQTRTHKFRREDSIQRALIGYYMLSKKHAVEEIIAIRPIYRSMLFNVSFWNSLFRRLFYRLFQPGKITSMLLVNTGQDYEKIIRERTPTFICINDCEMTTDLHRKKSKEFLQKYYPEKSSFEK